MSASRGKNERTKYRLFKILSFLVVLVLTLSAVLIHPPFNAAAGGKSVYLDGSGGSDSAGGTSQSDAVRSFGKAKELVGKDGEILVCGTVSVSGDTKWSLPSGASLSRASGFSGAIVKISGTLTLKNISLTASDISGSGTVVGKDDAKPDNKNTGNKEAEPEATPDLTNEIEETKEAEPKKEPEAAKEAEPTKEPEVTKEAEDTKEPEPTKEPEITKEPEATKEAEPTKEPEVTKEAEDTKEPEPTKEPEVTKEAEDTKEPDSQKEPEVTKEAEDTKEPDSQKEPEVTKEAEDTKEPEPTKEPEITKEPEATKEAEPTKEPEATKEAEPTKEPDTKDKIDKLQNLKVTVENQADVDAVIDAFRWYEGCTEEEKANVPAELVIRLKKAQTVCKIFNHKNGGITVEGDIPWYVQFRVTKGSIKEASSFDLGELLGSYELTLWDLLENVPYDLNGKSVVVTIPVKNTEAYEEVSVLHYFSDGSYEELNPEILPNAIRFTTTSFSPYTISGKAVGYIAGSQVIVGPGNEVYNSGNTTDSAGNVSGDSSKEDNSGSASSGANGSSQGSSAKTQTSSSTEKSGGSRIMVKTAVKTGDATNLIPYFVVAGLAAVLIVILLIVGKVKSKKSNNKK